MTKDEIFKILHKPRNLKRKIEECEETIKTCDFMSTNIKACISNGVQVKSNKSAFEFWVAKKIHYENTLKALNEIFITSQKEVEDLISILEPTEIMILKLYYADCLSLRNIANKIHYSFSRCRKIAEGGKSKLIKKGHTENHQKSL